VGYGLLLVLENHPSAVTRWLLAVGTPAIVGILISRLLSRLRAENVEAALRADELRQTEARTRLVLDSAPDAFITLDADGLIVVWNAAAERMFGWSTEEAIGQPMRALVIPPELRERHDERRTALVASAGNVTGQLMEVEFVRRDGTRFPGEATVSKVDIGGEVVIPGFVRDITARLRRLGGARGAAARAGRARRGRARRGDGERHAAAGGRRSGPPLARRDRGRPGHPRARRGGCRRRGDLPGRRGAARAGRELGRRERGGR